MEIIQKPSNSVCYTPASERFGTYVSVGFTPQPLYSRGKSPRYPLDRRLSRPQSRSERRGGEKILDPTGTRNSDVQPVASRYTDYAIPAPHVQQDMLLRVYAAVVSPLHYQSGVTISLVVEM
jgi:hypothetical protein